MPTDLDKLIGIIPALRGNALSAQTNRSLIEHGEHATIQKMPVVPAAVPAVLGGPGNTKGKTTSQVLDEFTGKTPEQRKAEQDAKNRALFEKRGLKYPPQ